MASKVWKLLWVADNQIDNNRKMQSLPPYKISSTNRQKDCYAGRCCGEHKMVLRYAFCKAQECGSKCPVCYRHIFCDSKQKWYLYQEEATFHVHQPFNETEYTGKSSKGIASDVKTAIDKLFFEKDISRPFKVHLRLHKKHKKNKISMLPSLKQVQNYIYYQKKKAGNI